MTVFAADPLPAALGDDAASWRPAHESCLLEGEEDQLLLLHVSAVVTQRGIHPHRAVRTNIMSSRGAAGQAAPLPLPTAAPAALSMMEGARGAGDASLEAARAAITQFPLQLAQAAPQLQAKVYGTVTVSGFNAASLAIVVLLIMLLVAIAFLVHNNWDVQAAVDEGKMYAVKAGSQAKKATHGASVMVEKLTRDSESARTPAASTVRSMPDVSEAEAGDATGEMQGRQTRSPRRPSTAQACCA